MPRRITALHIYDVFSVDIDAAWTIVYVSMLLERRTRVHSGDAHNSMHRRCDGSMTRSWCIVLALLGVVALIAPPTSASICLRHSPLASYL